MICTVRVNSRNRYGRLLLNLFAFRGLLPACSRVEKVKECTIGIISYSPAHEDIIRGFMDEINGSMDAAVERVKYRLNGIS